MRSFAIATSLVSAASLVFGQGAVINSPSGLQQCVPTLVSWTGGSPPYFARVIPAGDPSTTLESLNGGTAITGTSITWIVDAAIGANIGYALTDATGAQSYSGNTVVQAGTTSCLSAAGGVGSAGSGATTTTTTVAPGPGTTTTSGTAEAASSTTSSAASSASQVGSSTTTSASSSSTSKASGSGQITFSAVAAIVAAAGVVVAVN